MPRVSISKDEWYPYYTCRLAGDNPLAMLTPKQLDFVLQAEKDFLKAQSILEKAYDKANQ
jgi:hypothetical protein